MFHRIEENGSGRIYYQRELKKPTYIIDINKDVDKIDIVLSTNSCLRKSIKWHK